MNAQLAKTCHAIWNETRTSHYICMRNEFKKQLAKKVVEAKKLIKENNTSIARLLKNKITEKTVVSVATQQANSLVVFEYLSCYREFCLKRGVYMTKQQWNDWMVIVHTSVKIDKKVRRLLVRLKGKQKSR